MSESRTSKPRVLVTGATGTVGRALVSALDPDRCEVVTFTRGPASFPGGVQSIRGDLGDAVSVRDALATVDAAFYLSPHAVEEEQYAEIFTEACVDHRTRMVFVGSHIDAGSTFARWALRGAMGMMIPEFKPKFRLSERVRRSAANPVVLVPTHFFQNDEYDVVRTQLRDQHRYVAPFGTKAKNRIDVRDIARVAARALLDEEVRPGAYTLVGPASLSGPDCAARWGEGLGYEVRYEEDPELWEKGLRAQFNGKKLKDILATYRMLRKVGLPTDAKHLAATSQLLGREPTSFEAYVAEVANRKVTAAAAI